jgi:polysaccharide export outer membrane protein
MTSPLRQTDAISRQVGLCASKSFAICNAWRFLALSAMVLFSAGCRDTQPRHLFTDLPPLNDAAAAKSLPLATVTLTNQLDPASLRPPTDLFTLGPGDKLEIEVLGDPASKATTIVAPDGKIYFNLLPGVDVWGLTPAQVKVQLENELSQYVREKPQVSIILRAIESKRIWVLGRVQGPGVYPMTAPMTVLEAVSMAGGTISLTSFRDQEAAGIGQELSDLRRSFVLRQGKLLPVDFQRLLNEGDLSQNIYLQPDDFIYFPAARAREVYVLGAVTQPKGVLYTEELTVAGAIAGAYGPIRNAYLHHVAVVRGSLSQPQITIVDYKAVIRGEARDLALQPHDIVYVPFTPYRYLARYAELIINTFVSSAAINAGSAAILKLPTGGAGVFIPVGSGIQIIPPASPPPIH